MAIIKIFGLLILRNALIATSMALATMLMLSPIIGQSGAIQMEMDLVITVIYFPMIRWQNMTPTAMELLTITMRFLTIQIWITGLI